MELIFSIITVEKTEGNRKDVKRGCWWQKEKEKEMIEVSSQYCSEL